MAEGPNGEVEGQMLSDPSKLEFTKIPEFDTKLNLSIDPMPSIDDGGG